MRYLKYDEKLSQCFSSVIMDTLDSIGRRAQCMDPSVRPLVPSMRAWGEAFTMRFDAVVSPGVEGKALAGALEDLRKKKRRPPLFGLMHYERCRLILQPLSVFGKDGPEYLTVSDETVDRAALLKALKF